MAGFQPVLSKEHASIVDQEHTDAESERLFEIRSPKTLAMAFFWVHSGHLVGVDFLASESGTWLDVEFYDKTGDRDSLEAQIVADRLVFEERFGQPVASVRIDQEEALVRAHSAMSEREE